MSFVLHNTLTRALEEFIPLRAPGRDVGMYCCGPTVYDFAHIGNWRTFVFADLVRRYLEFKGFKVRHVMNITDVEDKIIQRVSAAKTSLGDFTRKFETAFLDDLTALHCLPPHDSPRATEHIPEIIQLIEKLMAAGIAYQAADRSIYFSIAKYQAAGGRYGQLVKLNFDEMRQGERVKSDEYAKESVADFALWKARVPEDGAVFWPGPWGEGRPGWHIECSAMSMKLLGEHFDLHLGGEDLAFPHHEDEIAQSEGSCGLPATKPFVKYWLHGAHLLVDGKKMSKSAGNFFTLRDLLAQGHTGREIRYLLLTAHYRETFNFTRANLLGARSALSRLDECVGKLRDIARGADSNAASAPASELVRSFETEMDRDLNVAAAWGVIFKWVTDTNRQLAEGKVDAASAALALAAWEKIDRVLGVGAKSEADVPPEITALMTAREAARKARDFKRADEIRDELKTMGWVMEDTPKGPKAKKLS